MFEEWSQSVNSIQKESYPMENRIRISLDAMGGDNAPEEIVNGAINALNLRNDIEVILVGCEDKIRASLKAKSYDNNRISIRNTTEVIETSEHPVKALRTKKDSSMVVGLKMVREKEADAFVSAGNSGAVLAGGMLLVGRVKGVERPPFAPLIPTEKGVSILLDCGANLDPKPISMVQFAQMGSVYMEKVVGIPNPRVAIVNVGAEEEKGNKKIQDAIELLKQCDNINFIGNIESREILKGGADVIVTDAFTGNVILKLIEGVASTLMSEIKKGLMSTLRSKIGALLIKPALKKTLVKFDATEYGGAPVLGLKGLVVKTHGNATRKEISNAILQCVTFQEQGITEIIEDMMRPAEEVKSDE